MMNPQNLLKNKHQRWSENGQSLVELALIITFLLILVAGLVDLGRMIFTYLTMRDAAQEGAVYGSIEPNQCTDIENRVLDNLPAYQVFTSADIAIDFNGTNPCPYDNVSNGSIITVTVSSNFDISMPFLGAILKTNTVPLSASISDTVLCSPSCPE